MLQLHSINDVIVPRPLYPQRICIVARGGAGTSVPFCRRTQAIHHHQYPRRRPGCTQSIVERLSSPEGLPQPQTVLHIRWCGSAQQHRGNCKSTILFIDSKIKTRAECEKRRRRTNQRNKEKRVGDAKKAATSRKRKTLRMLVPK